jgi:hypothetical protein
MLVVKRAPGTPGTPLPAARGAAEVWQAERASAPGGDSLRFVGELRDAELAFSALAPRVGLAEAFRLNTGEDGAHAGAPTDSVFRRGPRSVAEGIGDVSPGTSISWAPHEVHVAATGDVGITIGAITITAQGSAPRDVVYFTIWKRRSPADAWKLAVE